MSQIEPDYHNYSLSRLYDALEKIDREKYPERLQRLQLIIKDREAAVARNETRTITETPNQEKNLAAVKPGRAPSLGRGISEIVFSLLFAIILITSLAEKEGVQWPFMAFGVCIAISGVIGGIYHIYNAFAENRFTEQDIVTPGKEPDPFEKLIKYMKRKDGGA